MTPYPQPVLLFSRDREWMERLRPLFEQSLDLRVAESYAEFSRLALRAGPCVVIADARRPDDCPEWPALLREYPDHLLIAVGPARSLPLRDPALEGCFARETLDCAPAQLLRTVLQAQRFLDLAAENRQLRQERDQALRTPPAVPAAAEPEGVFSPRELIRIVRCLDNPDVLLERLLEELSTGLRLSRAGVVLQTDRGKAYAVRTSWMLHPEVKQVRFDRQDPFVRWFEHFTRLVSRQQLENHPSMPERLMLQRVLDRFGAEVIVPLRGREGLLGWLFTGLPLSGQAFDREGADQLILAADLMAVSLEGALLFQEVSLQKALAERLLSTLPLGIVYADETGIIRWCSPAAGAILGLEDSEPLGRPLEMLGPRISEMVQALPRDGGAADKISRDWKDPASGRPLRATAIPVVHHARFSGVLMTLEDRTRENTLLEKQNQLDRGIFWNQLAASMSHEVRNPLVSIKTFAQLLPERYQDPEFRAQFSELVGAEINRLNAMIDQLNDFAHPRELALHKLDVRQAVQFALVNLRKHPPAEPPPVVREEIAPFLPEVLADLDALTESIEHLLRNATEAMAGRGGEIHIRLYSAVDFELGETVQISIEDNGPGIPDALRSQVFSPFCTQKARGLGLGLTIAQRTLADHHGRLDLESAPGGTRVRLVLPAFRPGGGR